jgi:predicted DNA-binding transcriptional regulator AlpA
MSIKWATSVMEQIDAGKNVSEEDMEKAHQILADQYIKVQKHDKYAKNQTELASVLGVDRKTIQRWRKETGFPPPLSNGKWDISATKAWLKAQQKKDVDEELDLHDLKIRHLKLMCEKIEFEIKTKRGDYTLNEDVVRWVGDMVTESKTMLLAIPAKLAPIVIAVDAAEAEARLKESIDEALNSLHTES